MSDWKKEQNKQLEEDFDKAIKEQEEASVHFLYKNEHQKVYQKAPPAWLSFRVKRNENISSSRIAKELFGEDFTLRNSDEFIDDYVRKVLGNWYSEKEIDKMLK